MLHSIDMHWLKILRSKRLLSTSHFLKQSRIPFTSFTKHWTKDTSVTNVRTCWHQRASAVLCHNHQGVIKIICFSGEELNVHGHRKSRGYSNFIPDVSSTWRIAEGSYPLGDQGNFFFRVIFMCDLLMRLRLWQVHVQDRHAKKLRFMICYRYVSMMRKASKKKLLTTNG